MNQMNQIIVEGNVVRDTQVKETVRGTRVCLIPIATNRSYRDLKGNMQKETAFLDVEAWGENFCKIASKMARKGRGLRVVGRLKQERWKTQEGKSASKVFIVAEHNDFKPEKTAGSEETGPHDSSSENSAAGLRNDVEPLSDDFSDGGETVF